MRFEHLFRPGKIGALELKNRIVMAPMMTILSSVWGEVTADTIEWYARRAKGGPGLIVVEPCFVATAIDTIRPSARVLRADDNCFIPGLASLAEAVHENGAKVGIQLYPGAGAQAFLDSGFTPGSQREIPVSPSGVPAYGLFGSWSLQKPRVLAVKEIERCVELCGEGAERMKKAGFDLIEINAHEGWLIAQFLSPYFNQRTDKYGGSLESRCRFLLDIIEAMRKAVGPEFPITVKYSIDEFIEGGFHVEESQSIAKILEEAGVNGISCSLGVMGSKIPPIPPYNFPPRSLDYLFEAIKASVNIPVLAVFNLDDFNAAEQILRDGRADFIGIARGLIADPDWPRKVAKGRIGEIRKCIKCNACRIIHSPHPIRCAVNAVAGREDKYDVIKPSLEKKKVVVVGGGPAGMEAARVAAHRGHRVILFEVNEELGGMLKLASVPPHKGILMNIPQYYSRELERLGVILRLGSRASAELIAEEKPDAVIVATGGVPLIPDIAGVNKDIVITAIDVLAGKRETGKNVTVAGGGLVGCEVANFLAQQNKNVTIIEMLAAIGVDMEQYTLNVLLGELKDKNVNILTSVQISEFTDAGIVIVDKSGNKTMHKADTVVLALGLSRSTGLAEELEGRVEEIYTIGDAKQPRKIREAISEGFMTAYNL
ncbi:MAG: FAD-dependent oxidoreductase [Pseudomonadota bacterium]